MSSTDSESSCECSLEYEEEEEGEEKFDLISHRLVNCRILLESKKYNEARSELKKLIAFPKTDILDAINYNHLIGLYYYDTGILNYDANSIVFAKVHFKKELMLLTNSIFISNPILLGLLYNCLGKVYMHQQKFGKAYHFLSKSLELRFSEESSHYSFALYYMHNFFDNEGDTSRQEEFAMEAYKHLKICLEITNHDVGFFHYWCDSIKSQSSIVQNIIVLFQFVVRILYLSKEVIEEDLNPNLILIENYSFGISDSVIDQDVLYLNNKCNWSL